jgi:cephalosporin-C deacetylase-like acetyl esterase
MKNFWVLLMFLIVVVFFYWFFENRKTKIINPLIKTDKIEEIKKEKNTGWLAKYNFENLRKRENIASEIKKIGKVLVVEEARKDSVDFESKAISFESNGKKISGMMNVPITPMSNKLPAIIMIRGFAESEGYFVGSGSWKAADELARNGFITISLDFLGFGLSDAESNDILEARFEKVISVLDLIESVKNLDIVDSEKIGIWAHSNGGQIAISVLEISGQNYPTVLWAPMTNPFPKSVLEMVDDQSEGSLKVRQKIEDFEKEYDSKLYSIDNFYDWIEAPILIHQGTDDVWCEVEWQQDLQKKLKKLGKEIILDIRQGNDHNLKQDWQSVMDQDIKFFKEKGLKILDKSKK